jgi:hypothetical protein
LTSYPIFVASTMASEVPRKALSSERLMERHLQTN